MLIRAIAASAPSNTMFSVSWTLMPLAAQVLEHVGEDARPVAMADDEHVGRRRPPGEVDDVRDPPRLLERADDADRLGGDRLLRLLGGRADVVRPVDPGQPEQRQVELGGPGGRLVRVDVEPDPDPPLPDRLGQRVVVDDLGSRRVDEHRARPQPGEELCIDEPSGLGIERQVDAEDVGLVGDLARRRDDS